MPSQLEQLRAEMDALRAENARLQQQQRGQLSLKVSGKGGVSLYGLQRFPVTFYRNQWEKLLDFGGEIRAFIEAHSAELTTK